MPRYNPVVHVGSEQRIKARPPKFEMIYQGFLQEKTRGKKKDKIKERKEDRKKKNMIINC